MKKTLLLILLSTLAAWNNYSNAQSGQWTWINGDNTININGVYGTKGVADAANKPGSRQFSVTWTDNSGNLWLFGGQGFGTSGGTGILNDLWKYDITTNQWTWMSGDKTTYNYGVYGTKGTAAAANKPGARERAVSWTDNSGNLWLLGGYGYPTSGAQGNLNDLWKYDIASNQWTWVGGNSTISSPSNFGVYGTKGTAAAANIPGGRWAAMSWKDVSGNLWLFGGQGWAVSGAQGWLNDLWKYDIATNQWTWVSGDNVITAMSVNSSVYGTKGVAAASNKPGGRYSATGWVDNSNNLWLFGGFIGGSNFLNDFWKYDIAADQWTWVSGDNTVNKNGVYGTLGTSDPANKPGSRVYSVTWKDVSGNLWLFGGGGYAASGSGFNNLSDLWKYDIASNQWTWMLGDNSINNLGVYGTKGTGAASNKPGGRYQSLGWTDASGNLWLFGGYGYPAAGAGGALNDLWKFTFNTILPIELISFTGHNQGETNLLTWTTATEINNDYFTIEASVNPSIEDELAWVKVGEVNAVVNSTYLQNYSLVDETPHRLTYYRLKQTDLNGDYTYSQTISIAIRGIDIVSIYPNPAVNYFQFTISSSDDTEVKLIVTDMLGRKIFEKNSFVNEGLNDDRIDLSKINNGTYMLQVLTNKGLYSAQKQFSVK